MPGRRAVGRRRWTTLCVWVGRRLRAGTGRISLFAWPVEWASNCLSVCLRRMRICVFFFTFHSKNRFVMQPLKDSFRDTGL